MAYRNYGPNAGYVVAKDGTGDFLTLASALTAASSLGGSGTLYIKVGTYTENPGLIAGWNLVAWDADALTPNVTINGTITFTTAGTVSLSGIQLQTNSAALLAVTGSAASIVNLKNCNLNCVNNTGITYSSSNSSSSIIINNCKGDLGTTGIGLFTNSSSGTLDISFSKFTNSGGSSTANTSSAGQLNFLNVTFTNPLTTSSTANLSSTNSSYQCAATNSTALTIAGSGSQGGKKEIITSGSASSITIASGSTYNLNFADVNSSNTNAITGLGTLVYSGIEFTGTSKTINTTTQTPGAWTIQQGGTFASSFNINGTVISGTTTTSALSAITLGLQQFLVGNTSAAPTAKAFSVVKQVFTGAGTYTYTPTTGMVYCEIICIGAGGGGGGSTTTGVGQFSAGGGGGGGEYAVGVFSAATIGASQTITIGTGGAGNSAAAGSVGTNSSAGALITAVGGSGGGLGSAATTSLGTVGQGGTGGTGGSYRTKGYNGTTGYGIFAATYLLAGVGGNSQLGSGAFSRVNSSNAGISASGYGAGGSGGIITASTSGNAGGAGTDGIVIVTEYVLS